MAVISNNGTIFRIICFHLISLMENLPRCLVNVPISSAHFYQGTSMPIDPGFILCIVKSEPEMLSTRVG